APLCSRRQARRSSPCLPLQASIACLRASARDLAFASHCAGSFALAHICWRMQSRRSAPFLPSQAWCAFLNASRAFSRRSSQAFGSFAFEQSKRCIFSPLPESCAGAGALCCAKRAVLAAKSAAAASVLSMTRPFVEGTTSIKTPQGSLRRQERCNCLLPQLLEHRAGVRHLELAGAFDIHLLHDAVVHEHGEAVHARAHAARVEVELEAERLRPVRAAVGEEADL